MFMNPRGSTLDELLGTSIAAFDIPSKIYGRAVARYSELADWLASDHEGTASGAVYPQGSMRLGTMVAPIDPKCDYDVDLVYRRDVQKSSVTQEELKRLAGDALDRYLMTGPEGDPSKQPGRRCWTLNYPREPFHMDVLPTIPNVDAPPNGILLTDRDLREWQRSNPIDYADWFHAVMAAEQATLREALAKQVDVEDAPVEQLKTTLQRGAQALKRHRDLFFAKSEQDGPASIIITTLAARAYSGSGTLYEALVDITSKMPGLVETRDGIYWIENPVQEGENFADRWKGKPERAEAFFDWMEAAQADFQGLGDNLGIDQVVEKMAESFGQEPAREANLKLGQRLKRERERNRLSVTGSGLLITGSNEGRPIPQHTFHGDAPTRRRT